VAALATVLSREGRRGGKGEENECNSNKSICVNSGKKQNKTNHKECYKFPPPRSFLLHLDLLSFFCVVSASQPHRRRRLDKTLGSSASTVTIPARLLPPSLPPSLL